MIWFIADLHGGQDIEGLERYLSLRKDGDLLIILGDIELHFRDTDENRRFTSRFENLSIPVAFLDGNHENFDHLYSLPEDDWCGGRVHRLSPHIVHLMRGQIYNIQNNTFFVMGGCSSSQKWKDSGLWWAKEKPSHEEIALAYDHLKQHGNQVDYILTHTLQDVPNQDPYSLDGLSRFLKTNVTYKHWYAGHAHQTLFKDERHTIVFKEPLPLDDKQAFCK